MNLLMIAYYFPPRGGSGVQRSAKFAKYLPGEGVMPTVFTAADSDIQATRDDSLLKDIESVEVIRVAGKEDRIKAASRLRLGPIMSVTLRPDAHIIWKRPLINTVTQVAARKSFDVIYVSVQPWSSAVIGLELKKRLGIPIVVDFRDPWIDSSSRRWPTKWHFNRDRKCERRIFEEADAIIGVTPGMIEYFRQRYPEARDKTHLIYNGFDPDDFQPLPESSGDAAESRTHRGKLKLAFAGRMYSASNEVKASLTYRLKDLIEFRNCDTDFMTHSVRYIAAAIHSLFSERPELRHHFEFELCGNIPADNKQLVAELGLQDVISFRGMLPHGEAIELVRSSDAVFLPMMSESDGRRSHNASGKIFEYLAQLKPILALVPHGDAADIVSRSGCGWVADAKDTEGVSELLASLIDQKRNGNLVCNLDIEYVSQFQRNSQAKQLSQILESCVVASNDARNQV